MAETTAPEIAALRRSPLHDLREEMAAQTEVTGERGVSIREIPFLTLIALHVTPGTPEAAAIESQLDVALPQGVGQVTGSTEATAVLWNGPDEYTVVQPDATTGGGLLSEELTAQLAGVLE